MSAAAWAMNGAFSSSVAAFHAAPASLAMSVTLAPGFAAFSSGRFALTKYMYPLMARLGAFLPL